MGSRRHIVQTISLRRIPDIDGQLEATIGYDLPECVSSLTVSLPAESERAVGDGFRVDGRTCHWVDGIPGPSIEMRFDANMGSARTGFGYVDTGSWAVTRVPQVGVSWRYRGSSPTLERRYRTVDEGAVSDEGTIAYLGPHDRFGRTAPTTEERFRLIVPDAADLRAEPDDILSALVQASESLKIRAQNETVLAIAAPTDGVSWLVKGRQRGDDAFWVKDTAGLDEVNETWVHEYVHTRQGFRRADTTRWFTEGTADYFASWMAVVRGDIAFDEFYRFLTRDRDASAVLGRPDTWRSDQTAYARGRRACAGLDVEIRSRTGGERALTDLVARLNELGRLGDGDEAPELPNQAITEALGAVTDGDLDRWFERYVWGQEKPELPERPAAYGIGEGGPGSASTEPSPPPESDPDPSPEGSPTETTGSTRGPSERDIHTCPICGTVTDARYCAGCGFDLTPSCSVCGTRGDPDQTYCAACGTPLRE